MHINRHKLFLQLKTACVNLVAECNLSFNITQNRAFRDLLELTAGREVIIPSTHEIMNTLNAQYNEIKIRLIERISQQKYVCTTSDIWSSRAQAYFCMTVHFINSEFERESYVLAFRELKYKQTYKEITEIIRQVLREYEIDPDKVTHIITDGGSAFCKAFKMYGKSVDTLVEATQRIDENDDDIDRVPFIEIDDGEPFYSDIIDFESEENVDFDSEMNTQAEVLDEFSSEDQFNEDEFSHDANDEIRETLNDSNDMLNRNDNADEYDTKKLPAHRRCLTHLLNLVGNDWEEALTGRAKTCLMSTMNKLQSIWVFPRKSAQAKTYSKDILGCSLLIPCATRWNSKYDAICKIFNLGLDKMNAYIDSLKKNLKTAAHLSNLDKEDWIMISIYVKIMKPIAVSLDRLQGEKDCSQGFVSPTLFTMKYHVKMLDGGSVLKSCRDVMLSIIEKRFHAYFKIGYTNKEFLLAAVSMPRFKTDFIERDVDVEIVTDLLFSESKNLQSEILNEVEDVAVERIPADDFFVSFASKRDVRRKSSEAVIEDEIKRYLEDQRTDYFMLNDYPNVKNVFYRHNTSLSASAAVERIFSQTNMIFTPRRNRLSTKKFEQTIVYKMNRKQFLINGIKI